MSKIDENSEILRTERIKKDYHLFLEHRRRRGITGETYLLNQPKFFIQFLKGF